MMKRSTLALGVAIASAVLVTASPSKADPTLVVSQQKITTGVGGFTGLLHDDDWFGFAVEDLGDFDGDGVVDLVVGAGLDDDNGMDRGAVWILFLNPDGTVKTQHKISDAAGGFSGGLSNGDVFGRSVASLGDLDGDGITDLAVGARQDDDGAADTGAVWILFLNADATVKSHRKISATEGGFGGGLAAGGWFGISVSTLGDLDGDGVTDLAASAIFDSGGVVWILFLNPDGTVKGKHKISGAGIDATNLFGESLAVIGDVDGDEIVDLAVGELEDDDGGFETGAIWVVFLNADGSAKAQQKISATQGGFFGGLAAADHFGAAVAALGDIDADGVPDIVAGADLRDDGGSNRGALWILLLRADGTVKSQARISDTHGGFGGGLQDEDRFARSVVALGDLDGDLVTELAVGTIFDDGEVGGSNQGAVWNLFLGDVVITTTTTSTTLPAVCGDGRVEGGEECDDGNANPSDGCTVDCQCEANGEDALSDGCQCLEVCGDPRPPEGLVTAVDAAHVLRASVALVPCSLCVCDLDGSGSIVTQDALRALQLAVGLPVGLACIDAD